tara:strand:+ start:21011 stop:21265 length:255 start_codon:yes stop_codon:yes gene_type:complete
MAKKKVIHVNRQFIAMNAKDGRNRPVFTIKEGGKVTYARNVEILGPCKLLGTADQLSCGARAWIETTSDVALDDPMTFAEAKAS